ncbi:unnamed protein product [Litomosoides sigmodontis]|uniref:Uncharacterized protein n=1 Tax=Litomosoides sigmodontis TaxID=42156 RepID=A0A3P6V574_LITSI|nr:unnamed protein product [Litomosoides sigmodontis]
MILCPVAQPRVSKYLSRQLNFKKVLGCVFDGVVYSVLLIRYKIKSFLLRSINTEKSWGGMIDSSSFLNSKFRGSSTYLGIYILETEETQSHCQRCSAMGFREYRLWVPI